MSYDLTAFYIPANLSDTDAENILNENGQIAPENYQWSKFPDHTITEINEVLSRFNLKDGYNGETTISIDFNESEIDFEVPYQPQSRNDLILMFKLVDELTLISNVKIWDPQIRTWSDCNKLEAQLKTFDKMTGALQQKISQLTSVNIKKPWWKIW